MEDTSENKPKKHICMGLLAHVDAGKTTLAESMLYVSGQIKSVGRVDHKNAFLDTHELEKNRGITIFSKQAEMQIDDNDIVLIDTPGHVDFSAEMERTLMVLDYAILVISGADGVQGHVETLWGLLKRYRIPVFLFVNKLDQEVADKPKILEDIRRRLDDRCVDFTDDISEEQVQEALAECDEKLLEMYLDGKKIGIEEIRFHIAARTVFPCFFGSALKLCGIKEFLQGLLDYTEELKYPQEFGARVYKIGRDEKGSRLTYMKITGGTLRVKMLLKNKKQSTRHWEEKADQIRIYSGASFRVVNEAKAGSICAVTGLEHTFAGEGLGAEEGEETPVLEPVLNYQILLPNECDVYQTFLKLRILEEEEPQMQLLWKEKVSEIHVKLMGDVQKDILKRLILERFGIEVEFGESSIIYKETILKPVEGVGHFEPLRHYAEVHILLEPLERGSGIVYDTVCGEDTLDGNFQRLALVHMAEQAHPGVLTGADLTDVKLTLLTGKSHQKHTEGGDFRQAVYRAIRQGLKRAEPLLLEPVYAYSLTIPQELAGRAMSDIQRMHGTFEQPEIQGDMSVLKGTVPVVAMQGYQTEMLSYTSGRGRLSVCLKGYEACHNQEEIVEHIGYDSEADTEHPTSSVFCSHGAGYVVPWDEVENHMHLEYAYKEKLDSDIQRPKPSSTVYTAPAETYDEKELEEIFERTYGKMERKKSGWQNSPRKIQVPESSRGYKSSLTASREHYLLVDGYNIIFAWKELKELAKINLEGARNKLLDILCNYQGYKKHPIIVVFDAYKVRGNPGSVLQYQNIHVVYTKEAETADQYIEKTVPQIIKKYRVTVATSDAMEQMIIMGQGAERLSARGLEEEVELISREIEEQFLNQESKISNELSKCMPEQ